MTQPMQSTQAGLSGLRITPIDELDRDVVVEAVTRLERELFGRGAWSEHMVREELDAPARTYYVCVDDTSAIVGYAGFWYDGDDAELMTIGVSSAYQRRGIAAKLLATLIDEAREQGAARMLLEVRVDNDPALALYERFGFTRMGLRKRYYQPGNIDAYTMALDLAPRVIGFAGSGTGDGREQGKEHKEREEDKR